MVTKKLNDRRFKKKKKTKKCLLARISPVIKTKENNYIDVNYIHEKLLNEHKPSES